MIHVTALDNQLHILNDDYDFERLIEDYVGYEAGQKIRQMIDAADYTSQAIDTDLRAYESRIDEFRSACTEILKLTELLETEAAANRMNRANIKGILQEIKTELENVL